MPSLYKGKIPIIFNSLNEGFIRGTPDETFGTGAVPRDFSVDPVEMRDSPDGIELINDADFDALFDKGDEAEDTLEHMYLRAALAGDFEFLDQASFPDCWEHSTAHAVMMDMLKQNLKVIRLNAVAAATLLNRTNGGWCGLSMKQARDTGIPPICSDAPYQSRNVRLTPALQAAMKLHRNLEDWYDLGRAEYDQKQTEAQFNTVLYNNLPTPSDYNRFGHSMLSLRRVRIERGLKGTLTLNSWKGFGYYGLCVLANMLPDNSCSLRSSTPVAA